MITFLILCLLSIATVFPLVTTKRYQFEEYIRQEYNIDRNWYIPITTLLFSLILGVTNYKMVYSVIIDQIGILSLILTFALIAEGLKSSGLFRLLSQYAVSRTGQDPKMLIVSIFLLTSVLTVFTSNDVVILVLTPIILTICTQMEIENTKLILLSQFIAANTASMILYLGSPTNVIIANELNIDFMTYTAIMIVPGIISIFVSLLIIYLTQQNGLFGLFKNYMIRRKENINTGIEVEGLTKNMIRWSLISILFIFLVIIVTSFNRSLIFATIPIVIICIAFWSISGNNHESVQEPLKRLPYGIIFFAITFFTFSSAIIQLEIFTNQFIPQIQSIVYNSKSSGFIGIVGSVFLTNIVNDLPAATIIAPIIQELSFSNKVTEVVLIQSVLVGLNIGKYITQVGSLAGVIWFSQLQEQKDNTDHQLDLPTRKDLLYFGFTHCIIVSTIIIGFLFLEILLFNYLIL